MKKFFTLLLAVISTMTAFAQTEPAIELQAEVDGNTRTFSIGLATEGTVQIDWGNGEKVTSEVIPAFDGWNQVNVSGTVSGEGKVTMFANANAMTTVGRRSLEALRLQPLGKPPQCFS